MQFILQLKLCLYTIVCLLLEEFKISLKSPLSTQSLCHTLSPRVKTESESGFLNFIILESEYHKKQGLRILR